MPDSSATLRRTDLQSVQRHGGPDPKCQNLDIVRLDCELRLHPIQRHGEATLSTVEAEHTARLAVVLRRADQPLCGQPVPCQALYADSLAGCAPE